MGVGDLNSGYTVQCLQSGSCTLAGSVNLLIAELINLGWIALIGVGDLNWYRFVRYGLPVCGLFPRPYCKSIVSVLFRNTVEAAESR